MVIRSSRPCFARAGEEEVGDSVAEDSPYGQMAAENRSGISGGGGQRGQGHARRRRELKRTLERLSPAHPPWEQAPFPPNPPGPGPADARFLPSVPDADRVDVRPPAVRPPLATPNSWAVPRDSTSSTAICSTSQAMTVQQQSYSLCIISSHDSFTCCAAPKALPTTRDFEIVDVSEADVTACD